MAKRQFQLTLVQANELRRAYTDCRDGPTRTRYQAVWLYGTGYSVKDIQQITACSRTSLMEWCHRYREAGVEGLIDRRIGGNRAMMTAEQLSDLRERLHQYTPANVFGTATQTIHGQFWTVEDLQRAVKQWYGVEYRSV